MSVNKPKIHFYIIATLIAASIFGSIYWISGNHSLMGEDVPNHLLFSEEMYYKISDISTSGIPLHEKIFATSGLVFEPMPHSAGRYPNLVYLATAPFYQMFGKNIFAARLSNIIYIILLILSIYFICLELGLKRIGATMAVFICLLFPIIYESFRQYGLDLPLTSMVSLSILFLLKSKSLSDVKNRLLFGLTTAISLLIKPQTIFFIAGPTVAAILTRRKKYNSPAKNRNLFLNISILVLPAILFYLWFIYTPLFFSYFSNPSFNMQMWLQQLTAYNRYLGFFKCYIFSFIGLPMFLLFIPSVYLFSKSKIAKKHILLVWIAVPTVIFFFFFTYLRFALSERFLMPLVPAIAIVIAAGIDQIRNKRIKSIINLVVIIFLSFQYCFFTFIDTKIRKRDYREKTFVKMSKIKPALFNSSSYGDSINKQDKYKIGDLLKIIDVNSTQLSHLEILSVLLTPGDPRPFEMRYRFKSYNRNWNLVDFLVMHHTALLMDKPDFIIFRLPDRYKYLNPLNPEYGWPVYSRCCEILNIDKPMDRFTYLRLRKSKLEKKLCWKLRKFRMHYELIAVIPTEYGFNWFLHRKVENN